MARDRGGARASPDSSCFSASIPDGRAVDASAAAAGRLAQRHGCRSGRRGAAHPRLPGDRSARQRSARVPHVDARQGAGHRRAVRRPRHPRHAVGPPRCLHGRLRLGRARQHPQRVCHLPDRRQRRVHHVVMRHGRPVAVAAARRPRSAARSALQVRMGAHQPHRVRAAVRGAAGHSQSRGSGRGEPAARRRDLHLPGSATARPHRHRS